MTRKADAALAVEIFILTANDVEYSYAAGLAVKNLMLLTIRNT